MTKEVAIVGKPNVGKSLVFNKLSGLNQKVSNYPGVTVEVREGTSSFGKVFDFPGIYTFNPLSEDERVAIQSFIESLQSGKLSAVLCILDALSLKSSLRLGLEVLKIATEHNTPVVFALNMMDEVANSGINIDSKGLSVALGAPVVELSARTGQGFENLLQEINASKISAQPNFVSNDFYADASRLGSSFGADSGVIFKRQSTFDKLLLSPFLGLFIFLGIMAVVFQAIFSWSVPFMDLVDSVIVSTGEFTSQYLPEGIARDFANDAIFGGLGSFLVFVPQIFFLSLLIGFLEDSGYLARAALLCHRPFKWFGLSGKSFIPFLTGHACAIPAIFAARTIESQQRRLITMLTVPLTSCSARLPVYALLISAFIPQKDFLGGLIGLQGLAFMGVFLLGIVAALVVSLILEKTMKLEKGDDHFIIELPKYRLPHWRPLLQKALTASYHFVTKAGLYIFIVTVVVWVLGYFPNGAGNLANSYLGTLGQAIEPILKPIGLDWKFGVAILSSFLAREVFVGTMGTLLGIENSEEDMEGIVAKLQGMDLTFGAAMGLLAFYSIALQCVSTMAVLKKEVGNNRWPIYLFIGYGLLAYLLAFLCNLVF